MSANFEYFFLLPEIFWIFSVISVLLLSTSWLQDFRLNLTGCLTWLFFYLSILLLILVYQLSDTAYSIFNFQYTFDSFVYQFKILFLIFFLLIVALLHNYFFYERLFFVEFFFLIGIFVISAFLLMAANDFMLFYFAVELQALILYTLAASKRYTVFSTESGLKYFVLGALSSGLLLYGISFLYGFLGTTNFFDVRVFLSSFGDGVFFYGALFAVIFILVGLLFKLAAVPFHVWAPDVYEGSPTVVVLLFATLPKLSIFVFLVKLFVVSFQFFGIIWYITFLIIGVLSTLVGTISALAQFTIKRLYAYSAILNVGYLLVALSYGTYASFTVVLSYLPVYFLTTYLLFSLILMLRHMLSGRKIKFLTDYRLYLTYDFTLAFGLALLFFSFAGIPPLAGFFIKFFLFKVIFVSDFIRSLVFFFTLLLSVVSAFYYIRVVRFTFFDTIRRPVFFLHVNFIYTFLFINGLFMLIFFVVAQPIFYLFTSSVVGLLFL